MYWRNLPILVVMVSFALVGYSQLQKPTIKQTSPQYTDPTSGLEMYRTYCAVCHGVAGKGNGPAAPALRQAPPDLTLLSKKRGGEFPSFRVSNIIQGDAEIPPTDPRRCQCGEICFAVSGAMNRWSNSGFIISRSISSHFRTSEHGTKGDGSGNLHNGFRKHRDG